MNSMMMMVAASALVLAAGLVVTPAEATPLRHLAAAVGIGHHEVHRRASRGREHVASHVGRVSDRRDDHR